MVAPRQIRELQEMQKGSIPVKFASQNTFSVARPDSVSGRPRDGIEPARPGPAQVRYGPPSGVPRSLGAGSRRAIPSRKTAARRGGLRNSPLALAERARATALRPGIRVSGPARKNYLPRRAAAVA